MTAIDLNVLELGEGKNPFEELASKIIQLNLEGKESSVSIENLEQTLLFIERKYQDLQDTDIEKAKILMQAVNANVMMVEAHELRSLDLMRKNLNAIKNISVGLVTSQILLPAPIQISLKSLCTLYFNEILLGAIFTGQVGVVKTKFPINRRLEFWAVLFIRELWCFYKTIFYKQLLYPIELCNRQLL